MLHYDPEIHSALFLHFAITFSHTSVHLLSITVGWFDQMTLEVSFSLSNSVFIYYFLSFVGTVIVFVSIIHKLS